MGTSVRLCSDRSALCMKLMILVRSLVITIVQTIDTVDSIVFGCYIVSIDPIQVLVVTTNTMLQEPTCL